MEVEVGTTHHVAMCAREKKSRIVVVCGWTGVPVPESEVGS